MSLVIPMLRPILVPVVGERGAVARYVTDLKPAGGMYYTIPSISLTDFEVEFEFATTQTANKILMGDSDSASYYFNFADTNVSCWIAGSERSSTVTAGSLTDGKLHKIAWSLVGTALKLFIDGVLKQTWTEVTGYTGVNNFRIGTSNSIQAYLSGSFFSTKIWNGGDRNTGTLVRDYRFNDNDGVLVDYSGNNANGASVNVTATDRELMTFDVSRNAWLGQELVTQQNWENPASVGSVWTFANNEWTMTGDGTFSALTLLPLSSIPNTGIIRGGVLAIDGSNNLVATQDNGVSITSVGAYERDFNIAIHSNYQYKRGFGVLNVTISKPSFKRIIKVA